MVAVPDETPETFGTPDGTPGWPSTGRSPRGADVTAATVVLACCVLVGAPAGLLWALLAPTIDVSAALDGAESAFNDQAGADVVFGAVVLVAGLLCGSLAWSRAHRRGWLVPVALAVGGTGGALVASAVGHLRNSGRVLRQLPPGLSQRAHDLVDFGLRTPQALLLWPAGALLAYVLLTVALTDPEQRTGHSADGHAARSPLWRRTRGSGAERSRPDDGSADPSTGPGGGPGAPVGPGGSLSSG